MAASFVHPTLPARRGSTSIKITWSARSTTWLCTSTTATATPTKPNDNLTTQTSGGTDQFQSEAEAKVYCRTGTVVWANLKSSVYHFAGYPSYGNTKRGAYMCEVDATRQGMRAAKAEQHP